MPCSHSTIHQIHQDTNHPSTDCNVRSLNISNTSSHCWPWSHQSKTLVNQHQTKQHVKHPPPPPRRKPRSFQSTLPPQSPDPISSIHSKLTTPFVLIVWNVHPLPNRLDVLLRHKPRRTFLRARFLADG